MRARSFKICQAATDISLCSKYGILRHTFEFGSMSDLLVPVATYWFKEDCCAYWKLLSVADLNATGQGRRRRGILELVGQNSRFDMG